MVADTEAMFYQVLMDPKNNDSVMVAKWGPDEGNDLCYIFAKSCSFLPKEDMAVTRGKVFKRSDRDSDPQRVYRRHNEVEELHREGNQFSKSTADVAMKGRIPLGEMA